MDITVGLAKRSFLSQFLLHPFFKRSCHSTICSMKASSEKEYRKKENTTSAMRYLRALIGKVGTKKKKTPIAFEALRYQKRKRERN